jgi:hypothetical protein
MEPMLGSDSAAKRRRFPYVALALFLVLEAAFFGACTFTDLLFGANLYVAAGVSVVLFVIVCCRTISGAIRETRDRRK